MNLDNWDRTINFEVDGTKYIYLMEIDVEPGECRKYFHYIAQQIGPDEYKQVHLDWTPYQRPTRAELVEWVRCGKPTRVTIGHNLDSESLNEYSKRN